MELLLPLALALQLGPAGGVDQQVEQVDRCVIGAGPAGLQVPTPPACAPCCHCCFPSASLAGWL